MTMYCSQYMSGFGPGIVYAVAEGVIKVEIPDMTRLEATHGVATPGFEQSELTICAAQMLQRYYKGERIDFSDIPVVLGGLTPFRKKVLTAARNLNYGEICTYGQLAAVCNSPAAVRAVGGALAANPVPIIIPCHRVAGADGRLTGYSAPGGEDTKRALLKMEGIEFKGLLVIKNQMVMHRTRI